MPRMPHSTYRAKHLFILILMVAGLTSLSALLYLSSTKHAGATSTDLANRRGAKALSTIDTGVSAIDPASSESVKEQISEAYGKLPLSFEANEGQADERVKFISRGVGYTLFLTSDEAVLSLRATQGSDRAVARELRSPGENFDASNS